MGKLLISAAQFQQKIFRWFDQHGRKNLPWQKNKTPYRVWISEIMLQQTQVSTVIDYFNRFIQRFPDAKTLAHATEDEVLHLWTGLGYYSRARNLHRAAKIIWQDFKGQFPHTLLDLQTLPGIGRSTAGAIFSIAFQKKAAILDGNVKRVFTRLLAITDWPGEKRVLEKLWEIAEFFTPHKRTADYAQAMMDLGATICIRGKPLCDACPLNTICLAHHAGIEKKLPKAKPKKILPIKKTTLLLLKYQQTILLQKRPPAGVWGSLWSLPETSFIEKNKIALFCQQKLQLKIQDVMIDKIFRHTFSHFHLDILPVFITVKQKPAKIMDSEKEIWYNLKNSPKIGLPAPIKKLLGKITHAHDSLF